MTRKFLRSGLLVYACALGVSGVALLVGMQLFAAQQADRAGAEREETVVANGLAQRVEEISRLAIPQTTWDEAVRHLDVRFDPQWARENVGAFFHDTHHIDASLVLDRRDRTIYAARGADTVAPDAVADLVAAAAPLVAKVRAAERQAPPLADRVAHGETLSHPVLATAVTRTGADISILTATLVQPDFGKAMPRSARAPIVITSELVDADFVAALGKRFLLEDAHVQLGVAPTTAGHAQVQLSDARGRTVATLVWAPPKMGAALLARTLPPTFVFLLMLGAFTLTVYKRGRQAAEQLIASEAQSAHRAYHDVLTGLPNRAQLGDRIAHSLAVLRRSTTPFALHCVDLDRFKEVNDTFGHLAGDELIKIAAQRLASACRPTDLLARLGGDEFAIVQDGATPEGAAALADRIVRLLNDPIQLDVGRVFIGASVGIVLVSDPADDPQECLRRADLALYRAKERGRGQYAYFELDMDAAIKTRSALQADLRDALANDELELHYQPQVDGHGAVVGLEALVRWNHKERGSVSPSAFVAVAEETGLIETLGLFTLRRAFIDSAMWPGLKIAINVSAAQLRLKNFTDSVRDLVRETGVSPGGFELEITEGLLLGDDTATHAALADLRAMGFTIALDDFGTGYSSLSYLQRYPIDKIKIDRSFVAQLGSGGHAEAVVAAMVRLARALGLAVIAEGVETEVQRLSLTVAGCRDVQGYLTGRPMPAAAVSSLLGTGEPEALRA